MSSPVRHLAVSMALLALFAACDPGIPGPEAEVAESYSPHAGPLSTIPGAPCDLGWIRVPEARRDTVFVPSDVPDCDLEFRDVVRLEGTVSGTAPRPPVAAVSGGRYLTATFQPGVLAVWHASGELSHTFGQGFGEGPGEFEFANQVIPGRGDTVLVLTSGPLVHRYLLSGEFTRSDQLGLSGGVDGGVTSRGTYVTTTASSHRELLLVEGADVIEAGDPMPRTNPYRLLAMAGDTPWVATDGWYTLRRYDLDREAVDLAVHRPIPWFAVTPVGDSPRGSRDSNLYDFAVGANGLIWMLVGTRDPDAPSTPRPSWEDEEEGMRIMAQYRDNLIEVLGLDGRLVASLRYDDPFAVPTPVNANVWYRVDEDLLGSIVIVEPVLYPMRSEGGDEPR